MLQIKFLPNSCTVGQHVILSESLRATVLRGTAIGFVDAVAFVATTGPQAPHDLVAGDLSAGWTPMD